nr:integrase, catalytic region, zinc finger, CCHC-type, peptidase aspartic, catalytic [Tanacetum cinerariifolium]
MLLCKQAEKGVPLQAEQVDWLEDMDEEIDEQELEAHYIFMAKIWDHMMRNLKLLCNFVKKYLGTVRFRNDQFAPILCYGNLVQGNITIKRVYCVKGLNHNLFSVGQFCDADLEVAYRKFTCFVRDLQGKNLLTGNRGSDLLSNLFQDISLPTLICFLAKASLTQAWLWHQRLSHLNFDTINLLSKKDIVNGLPKLKYVKDQMYSSCEPGKAKRSTFKTKAVPSSKGRLNFLHMDLSFEQGKRKKASFPSQLVPRTDSKLELFNMDMNGPMRVESINRKKYILMTIMIILATLGYTLFVPKMRLQIQSLISNFKDQNCNGTEFRNEKLQSFSAKLDLEVAYRKFTCFVRDLQGKNLLTGNRGSDLLSNLFQDISLPTLICFLAKASLTQAWLWHQRLSHLNFDTINLLSKKDIVNGLPKLKYVKDQMYSSCEPGKAKRSTFKTKAVPSSKGRLNFLHMDLCGPIRIESINRKKYILVIIDEYSRYTCTLFLRTKDETP